jgi:dipeptidyl-peptidase-3
MQKNLLALLQQQQRSSFSTVPAAASILKRGTTMTEQFLISRLQPFAQLSCSVAFNALSTREKLYTHYLAKACWAGSPIVFEQVSPESPALLKLLNLVFSRNSADEIREISGVDAQEFDDFLVYAACFYGNHGNYLSFGDSKFIPRLGKSGFRKIVEAAAGRMTDAEKKAVLELLDSCLDKVYSLEEKEKMLNFPEMGTSTYYSPNVTKNEIDLVQKFMEEKKISPYNTRLFKTGDNQLEIRIASAVKGKDVPSEHFEGYNISIKFGDHHESLQKVAHYISKAIPYAANENQANMLKAYFDHFTNGPIDLHKNAQRFWIKDVGPVVETNIGFIESYRDPAGVRGEFEGFVAVVNKEVSKKVSFTYELFCILIIF